MGRGGRRGVTWPRRVEQDARPNAGERDDVRVPERPHLPRSPASVSSSLGQRWRVPMSSIRPRPGPGFSWGVHLGLRRHPKGHRQWAAFPAFRAVRPDSAGRRCAGRQRGSGPNQTVDRTETAGGLTRSTRGVTNSAVAEQSRASVSVGHFIVRLAA